LNDFRRKGLITLATAAALPVASTTFADRKTLGLGRSAFSSDAIKRGANRHFEVVGLDRKGWSTATPIRAIFKDAFTAAGSMLSSRPARNMLLVAIARAIREARPSSIAVAAPLPITSRTPFPGEGPCHVWMAPADQGLFCGGAFDRGCGHVFGLSMRVLTPRGP
jgi:hypothetical protein